MTEQEIRDLIKALRAEADEMEAWLDADRTITPVELSKWGPGWIDN